VLPSSCKRVTRSRTRLVTDSSLIWTSCFGVRLFCSQKLPSRRAGRRLRLASTSSSGSRTSARRPRPAAASGTWIFFRFAAYGVHGTACCLVFKRGSNENLRFQTRFMVDRAGFGPATFRTLGGRTCKPDVLRPSKKLVYQAELPAHFP
jgi:hypothetical protein